MFDPSELIIYKATVLYFYHLELDKTKQLIIFTKNEQ